LDPAGSKKKKNRDGYVKSIHGGQESYPLQRSDLCEKKGKKKAMRFRLKNLTREKKGKNSDLKNERRDLPSAERLKHALPSRHTTRAPVAGQANQKTKKTYQLVIYSEDCPRVRMRDQTPGEKKKRKETKLRSS